MSSKRKFCINCGKDIPAEAAYCPFCSAMQLDVLPKPVPQIKPAASKKAINQTIRRKNHREKKKNHLKLQQVKTGK